MSIFPAMQRRKAQLGSSDMDESAGADRCAPTGPMASEGGPSLPPSSPRCGRRGLKERPRVSSFLLGVLSGVLLASFAAASFHFGLAVASSASRLAASLPFSETLGWALNSSMEHGLLFRRAINQRLPQDPSRPPFSIYDGVQHRAVAVEEVTCNATVKTFVASPSIVKLPSGRLLVVYERDIGWGSKVSDATFRSFALNKTVAASDDGGLNWHSVGWIAPMYWPQIFSCISGVYVIGVQRTHSSDNNLVVSKMLDGNGTLWSPPSLISGGWSVLTGNTGVDVSAGRVTKAFEVQPSMAGKPAVTRLTAPLTLPALGARGGPADIVGWEDRQPVLDAYVEDASQFVEYTMVQIRVEWLPRPVLFRIKEVFLQEQVLRLRLEAANRDWMSAGEEVVVPKGAELRIGPGKWQYASLDWVAMAASADETQDLTLPQAWTFTPRGVGYPAAYYSEEMRQLFDIAQDATGHKRDLALGGDLEFLKRIERMGQDSVPPAWEAGLGPLYFMEGVATRTVDRHGGNPGKLVSIMRVNNDLVCDLAALVEFDDAALRLQSGGSAPTGELKGRFLRHTFIPGLSVAHPAILYDNSSDLYWMVSNLNRDALRSWNTKHPRVRWNPFTFCETDRSTLALHYSPNLVNWHLATIIDYHLGFDHHYTYPHMIVDGEDLLVVTRATFLPHGNYTYTTAENSTAPMNDAISARNNSTKNPATGSSTNQTLSGCFNNHNSNAIAFHRVPGFRQHANAEWATFQGEAEGPSFSQPRRRTALKDEHRAQPRRPVPLEDVLFKAEQERAEQAAIFGQVREGYSRKDEQKGDSKAIPATGVASAAARMGAALAGSEGKAANYTAMGA